MTATRTRRPGLTLVELMVAMAVSIGIVLILSESFKMGLDFARHAHVVGEQMHQLNGAGQVMLRDLRAEHFTADGATNGGTRLSSQRLDLLTPGGNQWTPPKGYFRIASPAPQVSISDNESLNIHTSGIGANGRHELRFTAILPGGTDENTFTARLTAPSGPIMLSSRAAEVAYFLVPMLDPAGTQLLTSPGPGGQPLYNLIRRQRLVAYNADERAALQSALTIPGHAEVISVNPNPTPGTVNDLAAVTNPANRLPVTSPGGQLSGTRLGEDIVLSNVLSFEVLPEWVPNSANFTGSMAPPRVFTPGPTGNTDYPHDFLPGNGVFDTWYQAPNWNQPSVPGPAPSPNSNAVPFAVRIKALQIGVRVFDPRTKVTRQNTWKVAM